MTPSSALQWVMITCYIKNHALNIILMIIRDRANHWSSLVYEATFSLTLHPLGSDLVWFHLHQIVIKCIGCIINQRQTGKRCWLLNDFFSSLWMYIWRRRRMMMWLLGIWGRQKMQCAFVASISIQSRSWESVLRICCWTVGWPGRQPGRHTFLNRRVFM